MGRYVIIGLGIILFLFSLANWSYADGFIIPIPPPDVVRVPPLAIKYHRVSVEITDQVARTKIDQVFINEFHRDLEGTYIFPLPKGANITEFAMYMNGERVSAELLEREKARKIYQSIVNRMKDPALLEYLDRDMFKIQVYPIPAHGEKRIQLEYSEVLKNDAGLVRYYYPLDTERFSSRPLKEVSIDVTIRSQEAFKSIYSPSHDVVIDRKNDHKALVSYEDIRVVPDKDFILYYSVSEEAVGANLLTYKKTRRDGYFMLMISPGYDIDQHQILPKDIVFVLDTSGSMRHDKKMQQAQDALMYGLNGLNARDRFGIVAFSTSVNTFDEVLIKGTTQNIDEALQFVKELRARGGTDIHEALQTALTLMNESRPDETSKRLKIVVFLTDGRPTVGITEYQDILRKIQKKNTNKYRIFTFGVGYDVNTHLLDALAEQSKSTSAYIEPFEDLEVIVSAFFDKIDSPVLSDLNLKLSGAGGYDLFPKDLPDLFKGAQLLLVGRYRNPGSYQLVLSGLVNEKEKVFRYDVELPRSDRSHDFLPRIWASRKIGYLLDQIRLHGEDPELKEEVLELAKKFGIVTPYTSYLVAEDEEFGEDYSRRRQTRDLRRQPSAGEPERDMAKSPRPTAPTGVAREMYQLEKSADVPLSSRLRGVKEGKAAVRASKNVNELKRRDVVADSFSPEIRYVGSKTFYRIDEVWIDSEYVQGQNTLNIKYGSAAYFKLLDEAPELGKYFSVGEKLILCWEEVCFKIGDQGISEVDDRKLLDVLQNLVL